MRDRMIAREIKASTGSFGCHRKLKAALISVITSPLFIPRGVLPLLLSCTSSPSSSVSFSCVDPAVELTPRSKVAPKGTFGLFIQRNQAMISRRWCEHRWNQRTTIWIKKNKKVQRQLKEQFHNFKFFWLSTFSFRQNKIRDLFISLKLISSFIYNLISLTIIDNILEIGLR